MKKTKTGLWYINRMELTTDLDREEALVAELHQRLTGWAYNWSGAYRQNIPLFLKHTRRAMDEPYHS